MNPLSWSYRKLCFFGAFTCFGSLAYALYVQYHMLMMPCPLCIFQRVAFLAIGVAFLIAALHNPKSKSMKWVYSSLAMLSAAVGLLIAGRHVAIQLAPAAETSFCNSLGLDYMLEAMPLKEVLVTVFKGSGECAVIDWTFLGLSMPMWTTILYISLFSLAVFAAVKKTN
jgi:disulfide bond formation protein DsbB